MEDYKSMLAMRSYFNFPEPCTDQGWLARKTQFWAGVSILGYKNTSSSFSSHSFQSLGLIINLCKVFRKQSWSDSQAESLKHCGICCPWKQREASCTLIQEPPCSTGCSSQCASLSTWDKTQKGSWAILAAAGRLSVLSAQELVFQSIIFWPRLWYSYKQEDRL